MILKGIVGQQIAAFCSKKAPDAAAIEQGDAFYLMRFWLRFWKNNHPDIGLGRFLRHDKRLVGPVGRRIDANALIYTGDGQ